MRQNLLLLQDVTDLGRSGEIVSVRSGYARNYLLPQKMGVVATEHTLRMQKKLQEERAKQAIEDKKEADALVKVLELITLETIVKVDPEGKMYGSVSQQDIVNLLEKHDIKLDKKTVILKHPIKETGSYTINFRLKEGVIGSCKLEVLPESGTLLDKNVKSKKKVEVEEISEEVEPQEQTREEDN